ncbi:PREDICTED: regulator of G-protein signaling 12 [Condylura cristata]|uniref:regulator of G-protein signaling 12 n=1 Tax=Condylura cristata TaxID=143302 RepID=UPI000643A963|nr:PREDICTED: regulator of G-protein signaling 12 [Condylura cristata]
MFKEQQLQIFNLMKFDSYARFLKSPLYQECVLAEVEGRPLPDAQQAPGSPASKRSAGSDQSSVSTPKKLSGKSRSGRSLNEDPGDEDGDRRRRGPFFSWSRTRSTGRSQKKKGHGDPAKGGGGGRQLALSCVPCPQPLVLHQDSSVLESRDLRLEKRTLFRLDLVPINRSVGLKAKPTKPVTEVLRPVVAKYGLHLNELVARLSGEKEPLDLGAPIASLDGQRVILEERDPSRGKDKQKSATGKQSALSGAGPRAHAAAGEERTLGKSNSIKIKGENGKHAREPRLSKREDSIAKIGGKKYQKINLDEAEGMCAFYNFHVLGPFRMPTPRAAGGWGRPGRVGGMAWSAQALPLFTPSNGGVLWGALVFLEVVHDWERCRGGGSPRRLRGHSVQGGDTSDRLSPPVTGGGARGSRGLPANAIIDVDCVAGSAPGPGVWTGPWRARASRPPPSEPPGLSPSAARPSKPTASQHHATFV